jgi:polysaccharide deacetylase family protein (PEP-CTERM system associated)
VFAPSSISSRQVAAPNRLALDVVRNCLTVDVEEWFHICDVEALASPDRWDELPSRVVANTRQLLELLDRRGVRATFFVLGWVALRHPALVEQIALAGHEVASHGHLHRPVYELTPDAFADELDRSVEALRAAGVQSILGFRAPQWSINDRSMWALDILARKGFRFDSSLTPLRIVGNPQFPSVPHARATPFGEVLEFPPLVERRFGQNFPLGGGWGLRMTDPRRVLARMDECNRRGTPVALFVHPWELDPDPPRVALPWSKRFVHYFRLTGFNERLELVLRAAPFAPMGDVLGLRPVDA